MSKAPSINVAADAIKLCKGPEISYESMKCDAFVEKCINDCGGNIGNTRGSNTLARKHCVWLGTIENAKAEGKLLPGAGLLINEGNDDNTPSEYKGDGLGDFSHIGLYVGENALYDTDKNGKSRICNAVHSSKSMGRVAGSTTKNGWTHVMWFAEVDYGSNVEQGLTLSAASERIINEEEAPTETVLNNEGLEVEAAVCTYIIVTSANGGDVRIREKPEKGAIWKYSAPVGTRLRVLGEKNGYYKVLYLGKNRYIDKNYTILE